MSLSKLSLLVVLSSWSAVVLAAGASIHNQIRDLIRSNSPLLQYPTQITQDIIPKRIHSHNDYWREVPLLTALSYGVASVEADVWLFEDDLLVGHDPESLTADRTFDSLYVQPLLKILDSQNPDTIYTTAAPQRINGIFDTSSGTSLNLFVDIKTSGESTLPVILEALKPLREAGYLTTYYSNGTTIPSAITVIGTGNSPLDLVKALDPRDYFFDGPLANLTGFQLTLSPVASTDYAVAVGWNGVGTISDDQLTNLRKLIDDAHALGIQARFWDTPGWPVSARDNVWKALLDNGVDWLNADDVEAASQF